MESEKKEDIIDNLHVIFQYLQKETPELCENICRKYGYTTPYNLVFKNLWGTENADKDIILVPGNPPTLIIADLFILQCVTERKKKYYYKHRLEWALERIHRVHRTLSNLVSISVAYALKRDAKNWARTTVPGLVDKIAEKYLEFDYSISVKDKITGTEITLHGENIFELKDMAVRRLSKIIFENEDFDEFHETLKELKLASGNKRVEEITVGGQDGESRINFKYEGEEKNGS